jgi:hypothetical protein
MNVAVSPTNHVGLVAPTQDQYRISVLVAEKGAKGDTGSQGSGGQSYVLPTASADTLGGIRVGENLSISNGVLSAQAGGQSQLSQLSDVQLASLSQGDLISYNQSNLKWINIKQSVVTDGGNF